MTAIANLPDIRPSLLLDFANSGRVDPRIQCTRASSATCFGPDGKLRTVAANVPRIDYDPATGKCLGLLVEEARTNLLTHSATFSSSTWIKTRSIISAATVIAPDGISFAEKLSEDSQNGAHYIYKNASFTVGSIYTLSVFAKKSERSVINISSGGTSGSNTLFDISAGTVLSAGNNASANIRKCGEDWFLCSISFSATNAGSQTCVVGIGDNAGYQGDGVSGIYAWGAQLEVGSFPASYIPTEASAVTRAADVPSVSEQQLSAFGTLLAKYGKSGWKHTSTPVSGSLNLSKHIDNSTQVNDKIERLTLYPRQLTAAQIARLEAA